ncbi:MAG: hypothetical protein ACKV0T_06950 [Planctomycetales bacterium]
MTIMRNIPRPWLVRIVPSLAALILLVSSEAPALAQHSIGHARCCGRQDVILIRGGAGYWPGAKDMANHFQSIGYVPTIIQHWEYSSVADEIGQAVAQGRMSGGVVIVGYSSGADFACLLAKRLQEKGIRVQTMVLIESTFGISVPENVDYCINYYKKRPMDFVPAFRGVPVTAKSSATQMYNINVANDPQLKFLSDRNHFTMCNSPMLHQMAGNVVASRQPAQLTSPASNVANAAPETPVRR